MNRRDFLGLSTGAAAALILGGTPGRAQPSRTMAAPSQPKIPRWRGFNLTELTSGQRGQRYHEADFALMAEWGFDFARLPCSYWAWSTPQDWTSIDANALAPLDEAIEYGHRHNIHLNLCLHRIPGYCVNNRELEPHQLFASSPDEMQRALDAAMIHWDFLAHRYRDVSPSRLSFDLMNEPPFMKDQSRYVEIAHALIRVIRRQNGERLIVADGADIGQTPVMGLASAGIVQSTRGYLPKMVSHYTATWVPPNEFESLEKPTWPMVDKHGVRWDRAKLKQELIDKWQPLVARGVPVHVGEWGCFNKTPHEVCLAWMRDLVGLWKDAGWGWSMWNLRGSFGVLDSGRADVKYEDFRGHQLDRQMLDLLRAS